MTRTILLAVASAVLAATLGGTGPTRAIAESPAMAEPADTERPTGDPAEWLDDVGRTTTPMPRGTIVDIGTTSLSGDLVV